MHTQPTENSCTANVCHVHTVSYKTKEKMHAHVHAIERPIITVEGDSMAKGRAHCQDVAGSRI